MDGETGSRNAGESSKKVQRSRREACDWGGVVLVVYHFEAAGSHSVWEVRLVS